jgi:cation transport ATPase
MLTEDERANIDDASTDFRWHEIIELLEFAEKTKKSYDELLDKRLAVRTAILINGLLTVTITLLFFSDKANTLLSIPCFVIGVSIMFYFQLSEGKLMRRISVERKAVNTIVDLLRENLHVFTRKLSELQKIQLKTRLSRFDIQS